VYVFPKATFSAGSASLWLLLAAGLAPSFVAAAACGECQCGGEQDGRDGASTHVDSFQVLVRWKEIFASCRICRSRSLPTVTGQG
jgi:hypothetical protein